MALDRFGEEHFSRPPLDYVEEARWNREQDNGPHAVGYLIMCIAATLIAFGVVILAMAWHLSNVPATEEIRIEQTGRVR